MNSPSNNDSETISSGNPTISSAEASSGANHNNNKSSSTAMDAANDSAQDIKAVVASGEAKLDGSNQAEASGAADQELLMRAGKEQVKAEVAVDGVKAEAVDTVGSSGGGAGE